MPRVTTSGGTWLFLLLVLSASAPVRGLDSRFNWKELGMVPPAKSQGQCGSCWAVASVAAVESKIRILRAPEWAEMDLSEQQLLSCPRDPSLLGCSGGWPSRALAYIRDNGLMTESCFPYQASDGVPCATTCRASTKIEGYRVISDLGDLEKVKSAIFHDGPVVAVMHVYEDLYSYSGGVYRHSSGSWVGDKAVLLVGWDDPGGYWIVQNTWGSWWGDDGFFLMAYDAGLLYGEIVAVQRTDSDGDGVWDGSGPPAELRIETSSLPSGTEGAYYSTTLLAAYGRPPYRWRVESGQLPEGLSLAESGTISGFPTAGGSYPVEIVVADSQQPPHEASKAFVIEIASSVESRLLKALTRVAELEGQLATAQETIETLAAKNLALEESVACLTAEKTALEAQLGECRAAAAALTADKAALQAQLARLSGALAAGLMSLQADFRDVFKDPSFAIPGDTNIGRYQSLIQAILRLPKGRKKPIYEGLGGR